MKRTRGRVVHVESLADLDRRLAAGARSMAGWRVRHVDLRDRTEGVLACRLGGAAFLGCRFAAGVADRVEAAGALVLPAIEDVPVDVYRAALYTPEELYDAVLAGGAYVDALDARAYAWSQQPGGRDDALAQALHDHAVDGALATWRGGRRIVGVMGGHAVARGEPAYDDAARLGQRLAAGGLTVATGGGPGAMEAVNLGAWLGDRSIEELSEATAMLAGTPSFRPSVPAWVDSALAVRGRFPGGKDSLGVPTWHYGHEPPNLFASAIAKYFRNATREAILLEVCSAGIVFLPGAAGTVQEVFQDACENYYADESSLAPMVLVGIEHWTRLVPAWPLLTALAHDRAMAPAIHLVDTVDEAAALVSPLVSPLVRPRD